MPKIRTVRISAPHKLHVGMYRLIAYCDAIEIFVYLHEQPCALLDQVLRAVPRAPMMAGDLR